MTDISYMGCMFQDIQIESTGFLSVVFCLTNVKLLLPALIEYQLRPFNHPDPAVETQATRPGDHIQN